MADPRNMPTALKSQMNDDTELVIYDEYRTGPGAQRMPSLKDETQWDRQRFVRRTPRRTERPGPHTMPRPSPTRFAASFDMATPWRPS
ncbi:hypothetical protein VTK73DRAFT_3796 [Phialemonium thermophilum]|uniref:Uncharacterized protein n=1 Tax=Phialemonium thermophilum TaxID=223376 RepID=A0ABR3VEN4_9PEZI